MSEGALLSSADVFFVIQDLFLKDQVEPGNQSMECLFELLDSHSHSNIS